jgi:hypothetical protein
LITVAVFAFVSYPLLRPGRSEADLVPTDHQGREDLLAQRDAAYAAIKELEFELHLGNLSQKDYDDLRARYRRRAADILRRLDATEREAARARSTEPPRDGGTPEEIERAVALLRQQKEGKASHAARGPDSGRDRAPRARRTACPNCQGAVQARDRFCGHCGTPLPPLKAARRPPPDGGPSGPVRADPPPAEEGKAGGEGRI